MHTDSPDQTAPPAAIRIERKRRFVFAALLGLLVAVAIEGTCWIACHVLQRQGWFFYQPTEVSWNDLMRVRHPILGWTAGHASDMRWDQIGSRVVPAYPDPFRQQAAVSLYGDSWTWSWPVGLDEAWGNVLAEMLGGRVNNFGICGYGTDQAWLRYHMNTSDEAPVVILGVLSENILRNATGFLDLINPASGYGLKPRVRLGDDGELILQAPFEPNHANFSEFLSHPERFLTDDVFAPGGSAGVGRIEFPHAVSLLRALRGYRFRAMLQQRPRWAEFYDPGHPSKAFPVTLSIIETFAAECRDRDSSPLVAVFPTGRDLEYFNETGVWVYQSLLDELERRDLPCCHTGPGLVASLGDEPVASLFSEADLDAHPNAHGYEEQARLVKRCLSEFGLVD